MQQIKCFTWSCVFASRLACRLAFLCTSALLSATTSCCTACRAYSRLRNNLSDHTATGDRHDVLEAGASPEVLIHDNMGGRGKGVCDMSKVAY